MTKIIDFHSHMLPGIDDGSPSVETSLQMLAAARAQGVDVQVLTPHFYRWREDISSFISRRAASFRRLFGALPPDAPELLVGSETAFFPHMSGEDLTQLCIRGTRVLLLEMPFESWQNALVDEIATMSLDRGYEIVLAHVERFLHYKGNSDQLLSLSKLPIHMQVNAEAFLHFSTRGSALRLIRSGMATILGSDAHNLTSRRPNLGQARDVIQKRLGSRALARLDRESHALLREAVEA
jgi:protein-tyrosine phosphatase